MGAGESSDHIWHKLRPPFDYINPTTNENSLLTYTPPPPPPSRSPNQRRNSSFSEATTLRDEDTWVHVEGERQQISTNEGEAVQRRGKCLLKRSANGIVGFWMKETVRRGRNHHA